MNCVRLAQVASEKNFGMLPRDSSSDVLVTDVTAFGPCSRSLPEAKVKIFRLISLAREVSKRASTDFVL